MPIEPIPKRVIAFFDGQNLFYCVKKAFSYTYPNYDPLLLARMVCGLKPDWQLSGCHFYTGIPDASDKPFWNHFWAAKLAVMGTRGIKTYSRPLRYRNEQIVAPDGSTVTARIGQEKGVDVRLALDIVRLAIEKRYDVALLFSQDQDLTEIVTDVKTIAIQQNRWIKLACAFPCSITHNIRGIERTEWIKIDKAMYDTCIDPNDYRPKKPSP